MRICRRAGGGGGGKSGTPRECSIEQRLVCCSTAGASRISTTGTSAQQAHQHNRRISTTGASAQQAHQHNRRISTTGTTRNVKHNFFFII
jgi:hypothetical protein